MEPLIIIALVILAGLVILLLAGLLRLLFKTRRRAVATLLLGGALILGTSIHSAFFREMQFLRSKVYPDLYLIKHPVRDADGLALAIQQRAMQAIRHEAGVCEQVRGSSLHLYCFVHFYEYSKGWGLNPVGGMGTSYFLEHEEDPGGFSVDTLADYRDSLLATFEVVRCEDGGATYCGKLVRYHNEEMVKTVMFDDLDLPPNDQQSPARNSPVRQ